MQNYSMMLPRYSIGSEIYKNIPKYCLPYGKKIVAIGGRKAMMAARPEIDLAIEDSGLEIIDYIWFGGEASYENVEMLMAMPQVQQADMIFAIGGGKALDTCKCLSVKTEKPVFTFPTISATCAAVTTVSIMYHADGSFKDMFFFLEPPTHAFINTAIISSAPERYLWAGLGDTIAKYYECTVSARGDELEHYFSMGIELSRQCVEPLMKYGMKAMEDNKNHVCSYELEQVILAVIVTTGLVSILITREHTPDYNSGLAHAIFYTLTTLPHFEETHLHGAVVGFGVLILLLCDQQMDEFERIYQFCKSVSLPVSLTDLEISAEQMESLLPLLPDTKDLRHYPYPVTVPMLQQAFAKLEERNRQDSHAALTV